MRSARSRLIAALNLALLIQMFPAAPELMAQSAPDIEIRLEPLPVFTTRFAFTSRSLTLKKDGSPDLDITEVSAPLLVTKPLGDAAEISLLIGASRSNAEGAESSDFNGFHDMELTASRRFDQGRYWLGGGVSMPTGNAEIERDQEVVAGIVANRILGLRVKRFGEGLDLFLAGARAFGGSGGPTASIGAGYLYKGEYSFQEIDGEKIDIKPGDEIFVSAGLEIDTDWAGSRMSWRGDCRYRAFATDQRNDEDVYEEGGQLEFILGSGVELGSVRRLDAQVFIVIKGDGSEVGGVGEGDIEAITTEEYLLQSLPGGLTQFQIEYRQKMGGRVDLLAHTVYSSFGEYSFPAEKPDDALLGSANLLDLGGGVQFSPAGGIELGVGASFLTGSAEDGAVDLTGFDLLTTLQWTY